MDYSENALSPGNNDPTSGHDASDGGAAVARSESPRLPPQADHLSTDGNRRIELKSSGSSQVSPTPKDDLLNTLRSTSVSAPTILGSLFTQADMESAIVESNLLGEIALFSRRSAAKSTPNEDAAVVIPIADRGVVLAVADGVGGLPQGEEAARLTLQTLVDYVTRSEDPSRLRIDIIDAIEKANRRVLSLGANAGTTLAVAQIIDHRVRTYHVGDSEIFVIGGRGAVKLQTLAHGPVAYGVHCGLIDPIEALMHEHRNLVSNIVGSHDMRIELGPQLKLAPRDLVVLCSDGITDNLHTEQIVSITRGRTPGVASAAILDTLRLVREQKSNFEFKEDDATFVLYRRPKAVREKKPVSMPSSSKIDLSPST